MTKLTAQQQLEAQNEKLALELAESQRLLAEANTLVEKLRAMCHTRTATYNALLAEHRELLAQPAQPSAKRASLTGHASYTAYCNMDRAIQKAHGMKVISLATREQWEAAQPAHAE